MIRAFVLVCSALACIFFEVVLAFGIPEVFAPMVGEAMSAVIGLGFVIWAGFIMTLGLLGYHWMLQGFKKGYAR